MSGSAEVTLEPGTIIRGKRLTYVIDEELAKTNHFSVLTPQYGRTTMRVEKITETDRLQRLNNELALLMAAECAPPEHRAHIVRLLDFGLTCADWKYITVSRVGPSIEDLLYKFGVPFGPRTIRHIAAESLKALREVHQLGWIVRNVGPNYFHIGPSPFGERSIYIGSYDRVFNFMGANNKPKRPRSHVNYPNMPLYASRCRLKKRDCSIRDDYEMWMYMVFDLYDQHWIRDDPAVNSLKEEPSTDFFKQKADIFLGNFPDKFFDKIPESMRDVAEAIRYTKWAAVPDREKIDTAIRALLPVEQAGSSWWKLDWENNLPIDMHTSVMRPPTMAAGCNILAHFPDVLDPLCKQRFDSGTLVNSNEVSKRKPVTISNSPPDHTSKREKKASKEDKHFETKTVDNLVPTDAEQSKKATQHTDNKTEKAANVEEESGGLYDGQEVTASPKLSGSYSPKGTQVGTPQKEEKPGEEKPAVQGFDEHGDRAELRVDSPSTTDKKQGN